MNRVSRRIAFGVGLSAFAAVLAWGAQQAPSPPTTSEAGSAPAILDHGRSYYHFMLARRYKELAGIYNRADYAERAISEYKQAIAADPSSLFLRVELAELYWRSGREADGIKEAENVLKEDPNYPDAHRLLSRIYFHMLDNLQGEQANAKEIVAKAIEHLEALVRESPSDSESMLLLGRLYRASNRPQNAEEMFRKALQTDPDSRVGIANLGELYIQRGEHQQVIDMLSKIPEGEMDPQLYGLRGYAYAQTQRYEQAFDSYKKGLAQDPDNVELRRFYAEALASSGKPTEARAELDRLLKSDPDDGASYKRIATLDRQTGRFEEARQELEKAKGLLPDDPEVPYQQAILEDLMGNYDQAVTLLQRLVKQSEQPTGQYTPAEANNRALFLERLGAAYQEQEKFAEALAAFHEIKALGPTQGPRAEVLIIDTLKLDHQPAKALAEAQSAAKTYPKDTDLKVELATTLAEQGRADDGLAQLHAMLDGPADDRRSVYIAIAQVCLQAKRLEDAEKAVQQAMALSPNPEDQKYPLYLEGSIFEREKQYEKAEETFKNVLSMDPLYANAANYLGYMLADRGVRLDESVKYIQKALELDPNNGAYLDSLGWAYYKMARYDLAEPPLEKAAHRFHNDPTIHEHLGNLYLRMGKPDMAEEQWERALKEWPQAVSSDFDAGEAKKLQKQLDELKSRMAHKRSAN